MRRFLSCSLGIAALVQIIEKYNNIFISKSKVKEYTVDLEYMYLCVYIKPLV